uniref:Uncharacterized protein n=2 Tax=viral metagenome TaxID=1070528 RepID=A0A6M3IPK1_9ZZZZ
MDEITEMYQDLMGTSMVQRGHVNENDPNSPMIVAFDVIPECIGGTCPIYRMCTVRPITENEKCSLMRTYLESVNLVIFRNFKKQLDETQWLRVGFELIPLYKMLFRLKVHEFGRRLVEDISPKGTRSINPIFKEIRDTMAAISKMWSSIGLQDLQKDVAPLESPIPLLKKRGENAGTTLDDYEKVQKKEMAEYRRRIKT